MTLCAAATYVVSSSCALGSGGLHLGGGRGANSPQNVSPYFVILVANFWKGSNKFLQIYLVYIEAKFWKLGSSIPPNWKTVEPSLACIFVRCHIQRYLECVECQNCMTVAQIYSSGEGVWKGYLKNDYFRAILERKLDTASYYMSYLKIHFKKFNSFSIFDKKGSLIMTKWTVTKIHIKK